MGRERREDRRIREGQLVGRELWEKGEIVNLERGRGRRQKVMFLILFLPREGGVEVYKHYSICIREGNFQLENSVS